MKSRISSIMNVNKKKAGIGMLCFIIISILTTEATFAGNKDLSKQQKKLSKSTEEKTKDRYSIYEKYGLTYNEEKDMFFYNGEAVKFFVDQKKKRRKNGRKNYFFVTNSNVTAYIKAVRNRKNKLIGIELLSEEEYTELTNKTFDDNNANNDFNNNDAAYENKKDRLLSYNKHGVSYNKNSKK